MTRVDPVLGMISRAGDVLGLRPMLRSIHHWSMMGSVALATRPRRLDHTFCERSTLADGTDVALRPIRPSDAPLLHAGLLHLSERSRYLRFHGPRTEFSPDELRLLTEIDGESHFALVAFALSSRRLVADGRFVRDGAGTAEAEVALVVADDLQGKGLGELLLSRLREAALERHVTRFSGTVLEENRPMRRLLRKAGARVGVPSRGVCEFEMALT